MQPVEALPPRILDGERRLAAFYGLCMLFLQQRSVCADPPAHRHSVGIHVHYGRFGVAQFFFVCSSCSSVPSVPIHQRTVTPSAFTSTTVASVSPSFSLYALPAAAFRLCR